MLLADKSLLTQNPYITQIVAELAPLKPAKIILFGSHAQGTANADSDLDLLVVTNNPDLPQTYQEKEEVFLEVARQLRDIRGNTAVDLIVHTRPMYEQFRQLFSILR